jgi:KipI family sensor histidine kinase inhibitor
MNLIVINETLLEYNFSTQLSLAVSEEILTIYHYLLCTLNQKQLGITQITPTFTTIAIAFNSSSSLFINPHYLDQAIQQAKKQAKKREYQTHIIDIKYNGMDIDTVCNTLNLTKQALIELHLKPIYTIAMLGFKGDFPYLLGLDKHLILPRRANPRHLVTKGSVAIAANQCGIYSQNSPGGWHIIATTTWTHFDQFKAGDKIVFRRI